MSNYLKIHIFTAMVLIIPNPIIAEFTHVEFGDKYLEESFYRNIWLDQDRPNLTNDVFPYKITTNDRKPFRDTFMIERGDINQSFNGYVVTFLTQVVIKIKEYLIDLNKTLINDDDDLKWCRTMLTILKNNNLLKNRKALFKNYTEILGRFTINEKIQINEAIAEDGIKKKI